MMKKNNTTHLAAMWKSCVIEAIVGIGTSALMAVVFTQHDSTLKFFWLILTVIFIFSLVSFFIFKKKMSDTLCNGICITQTAILLFAFVYDQEFYIQQNEVFSAFQGQKLFAICVALLAPPRQWLGWLALAMTTLSVLGPYYSWNSVLQSRIALQEPWLTLIYVFASSVLYHYRLKQIEMERRTNRLQAESVMMKKFAHIILNAQHLANTPLQIILGSTRLIQVKHPEAAPLVNSIDRSVGRIQQVFKVFSKSDSLIEWEDIEVPGTIEDLEKLLKNLSAEESKKPRYHAHLKKSFLFTSARK